MVMLEAASEVGAVCKTLGFCVCFPMSACTLLFEEQEAERKHLVKNKCSLARFTGNSRRCSLRNTNIERDAVDSKLSNILCKFFSRSSFFSLLTSTLLKFEKRSKQSHL